jgi:preprotein translocase subunit YajC
MPFIVLLLVVVAFYAILLPRRRQMAAQRAAGLNVEPGETVLIGGCIYGTLLDVADDRARVEIAPGVVLEVVPRTFRKVDSPAASPASGASGPSGPSEATDDLAGHDLATDDVTGWEPEPEAPHHEES